MLLGAGLAIFGTTFTTVMLDAYMLRPQIQIRNNSLENELLSLVKIGAMAEVPTNVIEHAYVGFVIDNFAVDPSPDKIGSGDEFFANVISQCTFHSEEDFEPLCVSCQLFDADGDIIAKGIVGDSFDSAYVGSNSVHIEMKPITDDSLSNEVQKVHSVQVNVCGPLGGQGCTPGYWKQEQHFGSWTNHAPVAPMTTFRDAFDLKDLEQTITIDTHPDGGNKVTKSDTFGDLSDDVTLFDAIWADDSGQSKLAKMATAALLNDANPNVSFDPTLSQAEIIRLVQVAYGKIEDKNGIFKTGDYDDIGSLFAASNDLGEEACPLGLNPRGGN